MDKNMMLDTNVFNHLLDGRIDGHLLAGAKLYVTHIQHDEINRTSDPARRGALLEMVASVMGKCVVTSSCVADVSAADYAGASADVPTESAVWGVSKWGQAKWGSGEDLLSPMRAELDALNKSKKNNIQDVLIAETALKQGFVLVTSDRNLAEVMRKFGGEVIDPLTP